MYFVYTNTVATIVGVGEVSPLSKNVKGWSFIFAGLLNCIVDCINHIHMYLHAQMQSKPLQEYVWCLCPIKTENVKKLFIVEL